MMKLGRNMIPEDFLMFSGNQWALYRMDNGFHPAHETHFNSWVYHCCNPIAARFSVNRFLSVTEMLHHTVKCWRCEQPCPDDILTVWKIHNLDGIQSSADTERIRNMLVTYNIAWYARE